MKNGLGVILCIAGLIAAYQPVKHNWRGTVISTSTEPHVSPNGANRSANKISKPDPSAQLKILKDYGKLALAFEQNDGQVDRRVRFLSRGAGYTLLLTPDGAVLSLTADKTNGKESKKKTENESWRLPNFDRHLLGVRHNQHMRNSVLSMKLVGANPNAAINGVQELPSKSDYFIGNDRRKWRTNISNYAKVKYTGVFPGVNLIYYGSQRQLEYDFLVAPDADPSLIRFSLAGLNTHRRVPLQIAANGDLIVKINGGEVRFHKPIAYQANGSASPYSVEAHYILGRGQQVSLAVGPYDRQRPLVIDPILSYSTYLGGSGADGATSIAVDSSGNAYVTGDTSSTNFPTTSGALQTSLNGSQFDAFVSKLNSTGSSLVYSTYLGGSNVDNPSSIAVDGAGDAYVTGETSSTDFPTTPGAFQTICHDCAGSGNAAFVTKLNPSGSALVYSTYLGGSSRDSGTGIALDQSGDAYVTGWTSSIDFPITPGCFQSTNRGSMNAFVTKMNPTGSALVYSTYLGGNNSDTASGIALNSAGNAYVVGNTGSGDFPTTAGAFQTCPNCSSANDVFATELSGDGSALVYSTLLGGNNGGNYPGGIALDTSGNAYVTGTTYANNFPTTPGAVQTACGGGSCGQPAGDMFLTKFNSSGSAVLYSTYLGGSSYDVGTSIVVDGSGDAYVGGYTESLNFPITPGAFQTTCDACSQNNGDAFITELNPSGSALLYSTYLGGSQEDAAHGITLAPSGGVYVTGNTYSFDFPTTVGVLQRTYGGFSDGFVTKFAVGSTQSGPAASVAPSSLDFGSVMAGTASASKTITLANTGAAALAISSIGTGGTNSNDFSQTDNCGTSVAAGTSCTITVTFSPTASGVMAASVTINDNASNSPQSVSLSGTGTDFSLSAATGSNCPSGGNCSTSATVSAGQMATYNLQVGPVSGFNGTVTLGCTDALAKSTCSVSPNSVTVNGTSVSALTVTVTTTAASMLGPYSKPASRQPSVPPVLLVLLVLAVALFIAESAAARNPKRRLVPALAILVMSLVWMVGCGGGSSSGGNTGTQSGTITITGTSSGVNHSVSLNLTVN
ncbi:MAG TPA: SBBP repeat-containing protein [Candidatus Dormibacteraeota bacterium]|nr:SBBP repeat-containing protein [Candidatus Dormibacteraeota bacterium]